MIFKITNLKKANFPDALTHTDYFKLKIGDLVSPSGLGSVVYQVIDIYRASVTEEVMNTYFYNIVTKGIISDANKTEMRKHLEKYKNSANFGICQIKTKCLLRGDAELVKGNIKVFNEVDEFFKPDNISKIDLNLLIQIKTNNFKMMGHHVSTAQKRQEKARQALDAALKLKRRLNNEGQLIQITDEKGTIIDFLIPNDLL